MNKSDHWKTWKHGGTLSVLMVVLMAVVVTLSVFALPVEAAEDSGTCGEDLYWTMDTATGTLTIEGNGAMANFWQYDVPWEAHQANVTRIVIGENVTSLHKYAFWLMPNLTSVQFNAIAMDDLEWGNYVFDQAGQGGDGITVTIGAKVTQIPAHLFSPSYPANAPKLKTVVFEEDSVCTVIGKEAFHYCVTLENINYPQSLLEIRDGAFSATNQSSIVLGDRLTHIGNHAFAYMPLTKVTIPDSVQTIGEFAFTSCYLLEEVDFGEGVTELGKSAFEGCDQLTSITIPEQMKVIGQSAFSHCKALAEVRFGKQLEVIGNDAFSACGRLTSIDLPATLQTVGAGAFGNCTGITELVIPDSVTKIGNSAFYNCSGLRSITLGKGLKEIGMFAFEDCYALTEIHFNATQMEDLYNHNNYSFTRAGQKGEGITVKIGANVTVIPGYLFCPYNTWPDEALSPKIDRVIFEEGSACKEIGPCAFTACNRLKEIELPQGLTRIGTEAFKKTGLTSIVIPDSVTYLGSDVFAVCANLERVVLGEGITEIPRDAFYACKKLKEIRMGNGVTSIDSGAFNSCENLTVFRIPDSLTTVSGYAFEGCKNLATVYVTEPRLVAQMTVSWGCGNLIQYAKTILIESSIDSIPEYVTTNYPYRYSAESEGVDFTAYSKNPLIEEHDHSFRETWLKDANGHWHPCMSCDQKAGVVAHVYDDDCDDKCDICDYARKAPHSYDNACDTDCNVCATARTISHTYDNGCDTDCNVCGKTRTVSHKYKTDWSMSEESHWHECSVCGAKADEGAHVWDEGKVTKEPTVEAEGEKTYTCRCSKQMVESVARLDPSEEEETASPAPDSDGQPDTSFPFGVIIGVMLGGGVLAVGLILLSSKNRKRQH